MLLTLLALAVLPAFPGAEGFGANTPGGRGGRVIAVTSLADDGPGTLRAAVEAAGPRIVVFRVGGLIDLAKPLRITEPFLTIAGQTAPGDGICLRGSELSIQTHDVVVRHLRARPGDILGAEVDAVNIGGASHDVILDHVSATWSVDEALSPSGAIHNITVQWCLIGESLRKSVHKKGEHGYGSLVRASGGVTLHHNLWVNNTARNPRLGDNYGKPPFPLFDVRNNVMYNWGGICSGMTGDELRANYVGNYLKPGPDSSSSPPIVLTETAHVRYFVDGNVVEGRPEQTRDAAAMFSPGKGVFTLVPAAFATSPVHTTTAQIAYAEVLDHVGATLPSRDVVDRRIIEEARKGQGHIIDSQKEVGGWPVYHAGVPFADADGDGMPDAWETAHGLNPRDASDAAKLGAAGYSNVEVYLNSLTAPVPPQSRR
jgi:hypothetical protein